MNQHRRWTCNGIPQDGKLYPHCSGEHSPAVNETADCMICGLPREAVVKDKPPLTNPWKKIVPFVALFIAGAILFILAKLLIVTPPALEANSLTIGIVSALQRKDSSSIELNYNLLIEHFKSTFGNRVKINIEGKENEYQYAKNEITKKNWDIVFTLSPMLSIAAKASGYSFAAKMFPQSKEPYYTAALFVKSDSNIKSIKDIKPQTTVALGSDNTPHSFYLPIYDLYGKTVKVIKNLSNETIVNMVANGNSNVGADVGAGVYNRLKNDSRFRIIYQSRAIPGSGVYLSPKLSNKDRETIKKVLLDAPQEIQTKANYGNGTEVDYKEFQSIVDRTEQILQCADFRNNPVELFCQNDINAQPKITGRVNGSQYITSDIIQMTLSGQEGQIYHVIIEERILTKIPNMPRIQNIHGTYLRIIGVNPVDESGGAKKLSVNQLQQIEVISSSTP